jgi:hypothetical protein
MLALLVALQAAALPGRVVADSIPFARLVADLSESGGYFDTDNLISNEASYLHVAGTVRATVTKGGAYLGVGPDQNFSYIAMARPAIAFVLDLRRDNQLLHLLFKSVFETSRSRMDFLATLFGRPPPDWRRTARLPLDSLLAYIDSTPADTVRHARTHGALVERIRTYGVPIDAADLATLRRFHDEFMRAGLSLRFTSYGRGPRSYYPTIRQLYLERDLEGRQAGFLAREDDYQFLRVLQLRGRVIPVVGDFGGQRALKGIGRVIAAHGLEVSLFYTSNVEFYLFRQGTFRRYVENMRSLRWSDGALIVRSYFGGVMGRGHPLARPGYASVQLAQTAQEFLKVTEDPDAVSYLELVTAGAVGR